MNSRRCCILYNRPRENALPDELDVLDQVEYVEKNLQKIGIETYRLGITADFMKEIESLTENKPDFVFNLVESISNKGELCYFIPALLNVCSIPYSGNPVEPMFITTSKALTGKTLEKAGITCPGFFSPSQCDQLIPGKKYIIKPVWEDGSMGITGDSVFTFTHDWKKKLESFGGTHWLIQDYIDGREFNISILAGETGPDVMPLAEIVFNNDWDDKPKIVDFRAKWEKDTFEFANTIREFPGDNMNTLLKERIIQTALRCWHVFGLKGYARIDMRIDKNDIPYVIEVNANPCISPDSGLVAATKAAGLTFTDVLQRIINDLNN
jgi:D-alanine-D-alanine ligase